MIPIQDLLHRIQWDPDFARAAFVVGYHDRLTGRLVRVPYPRIRLGAGAQFAFEAQEDDGSVHSVPLHRVRKVWRNGTLIWERPGAPQARPSSKPEAAGQ